MRLPDLSRSAFQRLRRPSGWGVVLGFQAAWVVTRALSHLPWEGLGAWEYWVPGLCMLGHMLLAPTPWQWTGDSREAPSLARAGLQALLWNTAWVGLLILGLQDAVRPPKPPPPEEGRAIRPPPPPGLPQEVKLLLLNLPLALVAGWFLAGKERLESSEAALRAQEREARTLLLQAQLHPHALYNVLGGLAELVHEDADAAEKGIVGLVDLLRMLSIQGNARVLPLAQERALLRRYLSIEGIRLGDRLRVTWAWPEWADATEVPPLLLQPLVENAVKHGIAPSPGGGELRISVHRDGEGLHLEVANSGRPWVPGAPEGTGLSNLRERLALLPGRPGRLELRSEGGWTLAEVHLGPTLPS